MIQRLDLEARLVVGLRTGRSEILTAARTFFPPRGGA